jgi:hypothetical protein
MDRDPEKKVERHNVSRICEFGSIIRAKYGDEGLNEYVQHIYDAVMARYMMGKEIIGTAISASLAYHEEIQRLIKGATLISKERPDS